MLSGGMIGRVRTRSNTLVHFLRSSGQEACHLRRSQVRRSFATSRLSRHEHRSTPLSLSTDGGALRADLDIYVSDSTNPYFNLTLEDWLFRHAPESRPLLLVYRDSPCVVIGRNQNPWTEVNFSALRAAGIPFIRRRSGGGTVFHDLGNTNFSIHLPRTEFDRHATGRLVLRAVRSMGIDARLNDRNDVCIGPDKIGSAYKIVNKRAYHHGTMLISTELRTLGDVLRPQQNNIVTKGVSSVRSPVCNLQKHDPAASHESFTSAVISQFREEFGISSNVCIVSDDERVKGMKYIREGMTELSTWEWSYGQTPEFSRTLAHEFPWGEVNVEIQSKHGVIIGSSIEVKGSDARPGLEGLRHQLPVELQGQRYGFLEDRSPKNGDDKTEYRNGHEFSSLYAWLKHATDVPV